MTVPKVAGIHHVKIPVSDLGRSLTWYERVFGLRVVMEFPGPAGALQGVVGTVDGLGPAVLALRQNPEVAVGVRGFDPVAFGVDGHQDIILWATHLDDLGIQHSPVVQASDGWMLAFADPDGLELHLYSWALHGVDHSAVQGYGTRVAAAAPPKGDAPS